MALFLYLERETRLASSVRPIEIQGVSFIPETGMDSIPDLLEGCFERETPFLWRHWVVSNENSRNNSWTIQKIDGIILISPLLSTCLTDTTSSG
jgi:hypothetical protein